MQQILRIAAVLPILAFGASAQEQEAKAKMRLQLGGSLMGPPVKGAPYAADEVTQSTQVLADGTRIHHENRVTVYRDSEGRVRRESSPEQITIMDPVAGASYFLNPKTLTAQKAPVMMHYKWLGPGGEAGASVGGMAGLRTTDSTFTVTTTRDGPSSVFINGAPLDPKLMAEALDKARQNGESVIFHQQTATFNEPVTEDKVLLEKIAAEKMAVDKILAEKGAGAMPVKLNARGQTEDLGKQTIEGVSADGTRNTSTIETGAIGNDRPIQIVTERWYSPELQTVLMTKTTDPRIGETSFALTNVRRGEPAAELFQVPPGYTVAERK